MYKCSMCGIESNKPFINGKGKKIDWCADCGKKMADWLML